ncbi:hypothetical protein PoB_005294800 [Plakobranchus ocellatus]|uniref:Uncharacterized protein n=1 Tax=Plakobranchus ocellatus TaxID=259542 RepID=A0AAV4C628_9GAST|nr:hypothetical protein PoB_005294800 [Plakobranchus ocellatus]
MFGKIVTSISNLDALKFRNSKLSNFESRRSQISRPKDLEFRISRLSNFESQSSRISNLKALEFRIPKLLNFESSQIKADTLSVKPPEPQCFEYLRSAQLPCRTVNPKTNPGERGKSMASFPSERNYFSVSADKGIEITTITTNTTTTSTITPGLVLSLYKHLEFVVSKQGYLSFADCPFGWFYRMFPILSEDSWFYRMFPILSEDKN